MTSDVLYSRKADLEEGVSVRTPRQNGADGQGQGWRLEHLRATTPCSSQRGRSRPRSLGWCGPSPGTLKHMHRSRWSTEEKQPATGRQDSRRCWRKHEAEHARAFAGLHISPLKTIFSPNKLCSGSYFNTTCQQFHLNVAFPAFSLLFN